MDKLTDIFKVLSDETRIRILVLLYHKKLCVCQMCGALEESQPKISKHLGKLRDMGFVKDERQEQFIFYRLNDDNSILKNILENIVTNIQNYPVIVCDLEKLEKAEKLIESCEPKDCD